MKRHSVELMSISYSWKTRYQNIDRACTISQTCKYLLSNVVFLVDYMLCVVAGKGDGEMHLWGMQEAMMK